MPNCIAAGKKRFYLTLNQKNMESFKQMLASFGAPKGTESLMIDEYIDGMVNIMGPVIKQVHESGKNPTMGDFFQMVGLMMKNREPEQLKL
jgi:hypothetical protein